MRAAPRPMLAVAGELPSGPEWAFEFKWDGVRALAAVESGQVRLYARSGTVITKAYPELAGLADDLATVGVTEAVLDGEIVCLDAEGRPSFPLLAERMHVRDASRAGQLSATSPATYMIFDVLDANGMDVRGLRYADRREWLDTVAEHCGHSGRSRPSGPSRSLSPDELGARWLVPPMFTDGTAITQAASELALEGVVAKRLTSFYRPGVRSPDWVKVKHDRTGDYVIGGWRPGRRRLGALLVGSFVGGGRLRYRGRVGGGISAATEQTLLDQLESLGTAESPFDQPLPGDDAKGARFVPPRIVVEVRYGVLTPEGRLRFPRFARLRPDKRPEETTDE